MIEDNDEWARCQTNGDPHMSTFDGLTFEHMLDGEFILYQHSELDYAVSDII